MIYFLTVVLASIYLPVSRISRALLNSYVQHPQYAIGIMERAITHAENVYKIPNVKITGRICKTNLVTNTAFRGFGGPQGLLVAETMITHIAGYLKKPVNEVRVSFKDA